MNTEITVNKAVRGRIFYDAACPVCVRSALSVARLAGRFGFELLPLQTPGTAARLGVTEDALFARMHLLAADGRRFAGADAFIEIARHARWARPLAAVASQPGIIPLLRRAYDRLAAHRHCPGGAYRVCAPRKIRRVFLEMP